MTLPISILQPNEHNLQQRSLPIHGPLRPQGVQHRKVKATCKDPAC